MARKATKKQQTSLRDRFPISLEPRLREEIVGLLLIAMGGITLLNLLGVGRAQGLIINSWYLLLRWIFGWGAFLVALAMIVVGAVLLLRNLE